MQAWPLPASDNLLFCLQHTTLIHTCDALWLACTGDEVFSSRVNKSGTDACCSQLCWVDTAFDCVKSVPLLAVSLCDTLPCLALLALPNPKIRHSMTIQQVGTQHTSLSAEQVLSLPVGGSYTVSCSCQRSAGPEAAGQQQPAGFNCKCNPCISKAGLGCQRQRRLFSKFTLLQCT